MAGRPVGRVPPRLRGPDSAPAPASLRGGESRRVAATSGRDHPLSLRHRRVGAALAVRGGLDGAQARVIRGAHSIHLRAEARSALEVFLMARWDDVAAAEPDFAERVRQVFEAHRHRTLATLRKDGSPRISGIEMEFADGEVWLGMMPDSLKARDLRRDPRLAVHSASEDPPADDPSAWPGDAKLAG